MQLTALNCTKDIIFAFQAQKQTDYTCIECGDTVRLRSGIHKKAHFFHLHPNGTCRQNGKSMPHLMTQYMLKEILPDNECQLEYRIKEINRIADVVWIPQKLVFEIQCSPISYEEVKARNASYASIGYQVIWILHTTTFNKGKISAAEDFLQREHHPHYFTDIDKEGAGTIFDHPSIFSKGYRAYRLPPLKIDPASPVLLTSKEVEKLMPHLLISRLKQWPLSFAGDYLHRIIQGSIESHLVALLNEMAAHEEQLAPPQSIFKNPNASLFDFIRQLVQKYLYRPYIALFRILLERSCRE